jgi:3,4-dihydroxy 2-butanone 4-phosphate synthase / GTP cyclohydrolase II
MDEVKRIKNNLSDILHKNSAPAIPPAVQTILDLLAQGIAENNKKQRMERVKKAIKAIGEGKCIVVTDSEDRENEGDLIVAAEKVTPEIIAFMLKHTSGMICCAIEEKRTEELALTQMVEKNTESHSTAFTVSVDYKHGTTTGISAKDRAATIKALADAKSKPEDFNRPGHMFPLRARKGGVLERPGHTEAAVDLVRLAKLYPAGAICELKHEDGSMMKGEECKGFALLHSLAYVTIADIIEYRRELDSK